MRNRIYKKLRSGEERFYPYVFEDMAPPEVVHTVHLAWQLGVTTTNFWERAALAVGDIAGRLSGKQLATACHAFGAAQWRDEALAVALAPTLAVVAPSLRPADLAVIIQSFSRSQVRHAPGLQALSRAAQANDRLTGKGLAMIAESFATLLFRCEGFQQKLEDWCAGGGLHGCLNEQAVVLAHASSLLAPPASPLLALACRNSRGGLAASLATRLGGIAGELEPAVLHIAVLSLARMQAADWVLVESLERAVAQELHRFEIKALPGVLDAFTQLYTICATEKSSGACKKGADSALAHADRRAFVTRLAGRIARELGLLRPQDAGRALQALDRLGVFDPLLLAGAEKMVPSQLAAWPPAEVLGLLEAYAAAGNVDGFMLPYLGRALLGTPTDPGAIKLLDDVEVARTSIAFARLRYGVGAMAVLSALDAPLAAGRPARRVTASCEFAVASAAAAVLQNPDAWDAAIAEFVGTRAAAELAAASLAEPASGSRDAEVAPDRRRWLASADPDNHQADDVLLASCAFPEHPRQGAWAEALKSRLGECSAGLLPGLLLRSSGADGAAHLVRAAEEALLQQLSEGAAASLPAAAAVAAASALARRAAGRSAPEKVPLRDAAEQIGRRLAGLAEAGELPAKGIVRTLQVLRSLSVEPPLPLLRALARAGAALSPVELLVALRLLSARGIRDSASADDLSALATRVMGQFRSTRQAWELESLCKSLGLDLGEVEPVEPAEAAEYGEAGVRSAAQAR